MLWLTTVAPPALLLVPLMHAGAQLDIDAWRCGKPEAFGNFYQIEFVHIKYRP